MIILRWLQGLRLTLTQWLLVTMAAALAVLYAAFRLQGGRLHRAQVALLGQQVDVKVARGDEDVAAARERFDKANREWKKARNKRPS